MKNIIYILYLAIGISVLSASAQADTYVSLDSVHQIFIGTSSSGANQVWFSAEGQPSGVPSDCMFNGNAMFYVPDDGNLDTDKVQSLLLTAKVANQPIGLVFNVLSTSSDLWSLGVTKCVALRLVMR